MASPTLGRRTRFAPPVHAQVDWAHPLAASLVTCIVGGGYNDLAVGGSPTSRPSGPTLGATGLGNGWQVSSGASVDTIRASNLSFRNGVPAPATARVVMKANSWPGGFTALFEKGVSGGDRDFGIFIDTSGNVSFGSVGKSSVTPLPSLGLTLGVTWDLVFTHDGNTAFRTYVNGRLHTASSTGLPQSTTVAPICFGRSTTGNTATDGTYSLGQVWERCLSDSDVAQLYADPFCMLRW